MKRKLSFLLIFCCAYLVSFADIEPLDSIELFEQQTDDIEEAIEDKEQTDEEQIELLYQILETLDNKRPAWVIPREDED